MSIDTCEYKYWELVGCVHKPLAKKKTVFWTKSLRVAGKMNIWAMLVQPSSWLFYKPLNASSENYNLLSVK